MCCLTVRQRTAVGKEHAVCTAIVQERLACLPPSSLTQNGPVVASAATTPADTARKAGTIDGSSSSSGSDAKTQPPSSSGNPICLRRSPVASLLWPRQRAATAAVPKGTAVSSTALSWESLLPQCLPVLLLLLLGCRLRAVLLSRSACTSMGTKYTRPSRAMSWGTRWITESKSEDEIVCVCVCRAKCETGSVTQRERESYT